MAKKKIKLRFFIIIPIIFLILMYNLLSKNITYSVVNFGELKLTEKCRGVVITNEKIVKSPVDGRVKFLEPSGDREPKGSLVASVYKDDKVLRYKKKLATVNSKINDTVTFDTSNPTFKNDINKIDKMINDKLSLMQTNIQNGDVRDIYHLKKEVKSLFDKKLTVAKGFNQNNLDIDRETLDKEKNYLQQYVNTYELPIRSEQPGLISYYFDGLEDTFSSVNISKLTCDDIDSLSHKESNEKKVARTVKSGDPLYKIIHDYKWDLVLVLNKTKVKPLKVGDFVKIDFKGHIADAYVSSIQKEDQNYIIDLKLDELLENVYNERVIDFTLIKRTYSGVTLPKAAVTKKYIITVKYHGKIKKGSLNRSGDFLIQFSDKAKGVNSKMLNRFYENGTYTFYLLIEDKGASLSDNSNIVSLSKDGNVYNIKSEDFAYSRVHGVYASRIGVIKFIPVKLQAVRGKTAIVSNFEDGKYGVSDGLKYYDKVISTPNYVKEDTLFH